MKTQLFRLICAMIVLAPTASFAKECKVQRLYRSAQGAMQFSSIEPMTGAANSSKSACKYACGQAKRYIPGMDASKLNTPRPISKVNVRCIFVGPRDTGVSQAIIDKTTMPFRILKVQQAQKTPERGSTAGNTTTIRPNVVGGTVTTIVTPSTASERSGTVNNAVPTGSGRPTFDPSKRRNPVRGTTRY